MNAIYKKIKQRIQGIFFYARFFQDCKRYGQKVKQINEAAAKHQWPELKRVYNIQRMFAKWMKALFSRENIHVTHIGLELLPQDGKGVIISNHRSFFDIMVLTPFLPPNKTIAKIELTKIPFMHSFGRICTAGSVLVDRKSKESKDKAQKAMENLSQEGLLGVYYPEGTRNKQCLPLLDFKPGAFLVAKRKNLPIYCATIIGAGEVLPRNMSFNPGRVIIEVTGPFLPEEKENIKDFSQRIKTYMEGRISILQ